MDSYFGRSGIRQHSQQTFEIPSHTTSSLGISLKPIDMPCAYHPQQQSSNYCVQTRCQQALCAQCIEDHLLHHKNHGYSDLKIKSLKGTRAECIRRLEKLIQQLIRKLSGLEAPLPPEQQLQNLDHKLELMREKMHQIVDNQCQRLKDSFQIAMNESAAHFQQMAEIHSKLENLIEQLRENHDTLIQGNRKGFTVADCIKTTLTLDSDALLDTFEQEGAAYEARRLRSQLDLSFQPDLLKECLPDVIRIILPQSPSPIMGASKISRSPIQTKRVPVKFQGEEEIGVDNLPSVAIPRGSGKSLHFFQTGSNKLHLVSLDGRRATQKIVAINQFVVPSYHASVMSESGEFIFLSGGIIEINGSTKSPRLIRFSVRTKACKIDFAKVRPRSSHTLCEDGKGEIFILGGYGPSQFEGGDPTFEMTVQRVNPRSGKIQIEASSNWGGSNIAMLCNGQILKACEEGIQIYNQKNRQWIVAEIKTRPRSEYTFFKNPGFACLSQTDIFVFGGYYSDSTSSDVCFSWKIKGGNSLQVTTSHINNCRLPVAAGFENCCPLVDEEGLWVLQNVEDEEQNCVQSERRLLRFTLHDQTWTIVDTVIE